MNRIVIVTGGSDGIGKALAYAFAANNDKVIIIDRNTEPLKIISESMGSNVTWQQADVSQQPQVASTIKAITEKYKIIDVLVNNAGITQDIDIQTPLIEAEQLWDKIINTNLKGSFLMVMASLPYIRKPGGRIINISSIAALSGGTHGGSMGYAASKMGVHGLTYALARELGPCGVTVNVVAPGYIANTGMTRNWSEERVERTIAQTPVGRAGHVDDIVAAVLFLASEHASFVTGQVLHVNGGRIFGL